MVRRSEKEVRHRRVQDSTTPSDGCSTSDRLISEKLSRDKGKRTYEVTGTAEFLSRVDHLLQTIAYLGGVGASRTVEFFVDGDGSDRLGVKGTESDVDKKKIDTDKDAVKVP